MDAGGFSILRLFDGKIRQPNPNVLLRQEYIRP